MKKKFWVVNEVSPTTAEILLYGYIGMYEQIDDASFVMDLRTLEAKYPTIHIRINCGGGDVYKGITIFNAIRNSKCLTKSFIDGVAASMGAVIAAATKETYISKYGRYMTHRVQGGNFGNADEMRSWADEMEQLEDNIASILGKKTGLSKDEAKTKYITDKDRWIGADQAVQEKIVDGIYDADPVEVPKDASVENVYNAFQQTFINRLPKQDNDMKAIALLLGLPENATEAEIIAAINKVKTDKDNAVNAQKTAAKARAKTLVNAAIASGKLLESERAEYEEQAENNYEFTAKSIDKMQGTKKPSQIINPENKLTSDSRDETIDSWETLVAKGESFVAEFKKNNLEEYTNLLNVYRAKPVE